MLKIFKQYYPIRNIFFVLGEALVILISFLLASWLILGSDPLADDRWFPAKIMFITFVCQLFLYYYDLYDFKVTSSFSELTIRLLQALGTATIFLAVFYFAFPRMIIGQGVFVASIILVICLIASWRYLYTLVLNRGMFNERIGLLGSGELADTILNEITDKKDCGYTVSVLAVEGDNKSSDTKDNTMICLKGFDGLCDIAGKMDIRKIIVALKQKRGALPIEELLKCRVEGIEVLEGNSFYEMLTGKLIVEQTYPAWLIFSEGFRRSNAVFFTKRIFDLIFSFILLIVFFPVIIVTALLIKIDSKGPVIFSQERVGQKKKLFMVHKFRSMIANAEQHSGPTWAKDKDDRITCVGKVIRNLRIDELPQLWNVLKGEMSFVGPRPEREYFVNQLEAGIPYYRERFSVKPGLTGWAQVSYGYGATVEDAIQKLNYELFYIKNMSILMDLMIVMRTIKTVLLGKGAR